MRKLATQNGRPSVALIEALENVIHSADLYLGMPPDVDPGAITWCPGIKPLHEALGDHGYPIAGSLRVATQLGGDEIELTANLILTHFEQVSNGN